VIGFIASPEARPSVNEHCAMTALTPSTGMDGVPAAEGGPPDHDATPVDLRKPARERDGRTPVGLLLADIQQLARCSFAASEMPIVENQAGIPGGLETFGIRIQPHLPHSAQTVRHHDDGWRPAALREVQPCCAALAL
jgi:hypothetical protein